MASTRWRKVWANDHSSSTDSSWVPGGIEADALDRRRPHRLQTGPPGSEIRRLGPAQGHPLRVAPVELGLHQRGDLDTPDAQPLDLAVEVGVDERHTAHVHTSEVDEAEPRFAQVDRPELCAAHVPAGEPAAATQIIVTRRAGHAEERMQGRSATRSVLRSVAQKRATRGLTTSAHGSAEVLAVGRQGLEPWDTRDRR